MWIQTSWETNHEVKTNIFTCFWYWCWKNPFFNVKLKLLKNFNFSQFHEHIFRGNRAQMFFKIGVLKRFANFTGKHLCWSLFLKNLQAEGLQLHKRRLQHRCFPVKFAKLLRTPFLTEHLRWVLLHLRWLLLYFFKKVLLNSFFWQPCYDVLIIFSSRHIVWCIKSRTRLFINLSSIVRFSKYLRQGVPYKAENWHALSHEQYFSKHRFLDICRCTFKPIIRTKLNIVIIHTIKIAFSSLLPGHMSLIERA